MKKDVMVLLWLTSFLMTPTTGKCVRRQSPSKPVDCYSPYRSD